MTALAPFAPMVLGVAGGVAAMLLDAWGHRAASIACAILGLVAGGAVAALAALGPQTLGIVGSGGDFAPVQAVCFALGAASLAASARTLVSSTAAVRIAALAALATTAAATMTVSRDLVLLFLSVEALALCGYGLVALADTDRAREAAMKWFIQGSVATALFIVGIAVLMSRTGGSLSYDALAAQASAPAASGPLAIGVVLVLAALAFKAGAFPFHSWMPDALQEAPPAAAAVLASAGKVGPLAAAAWLAMAVTGATGDRALGVVALVSVGSMVFGNLAALRQRSLARLLAYSAIAQVGHALAGIPPADGRVPVLVFAMIYGLTAAASFVFIVAMRENEPAWDGTVDGLAGLSRRAPALAASLTVIMLSLTGIPLTAGFWGKYLVFGTAATGGYLWLAIAAVIGTVVSFGYYGRVIRAAYMDGAPAAGETSDERQTGLRGVAAVGTVVFAVAIVVVGVFPLLT